ncbi:NADPH-dependent FMN reductase [Streptomyces sp. GSL17-111]|uniref:NADPH-dependent FMN reductase n=1 Tax=Streptomyces sp. GSL17-111 TaxID=3121596 RepID=UPI0030F3E11B
MATILMLHGSPSAHSRTAAMLRHVERWLSDAGLSVRSVAVRDLPSAALLNADSADLAIRDVVGSVEEADGIIVATPVYKAAYSGLLKVLLDLLPQSALAGKPVLPLATGGSTAHVLSIDYALRPVLTALGADHVLRGYFVLDRLLTRQDGGEVLIDSEVAAQLTTRVGQFASLVSREATRTTNPAFSPLA